MKHLLANKARQQIISRALERSELAISNDSKMQFIWDGIYETAALNALAGGKVSDYLMYRNFQNHIYFYTDKQAA